MKLTPPLVVSAVPPADITGTGICRLSKRNSKDASETG